MITAKESFEKSKEAAKKAADAYYQKKEIEQIKDLINQAQERLAKLEVTQEFKDGDVIIVLNKNAGKHISITKGGRIKEGSLANPYYAALGFFNKTGYESCCGYFPPADTIRLATPEEAQILFDALAKDGKRWNAETKQIEKLRWRAKNGARYFYADALFNTCEMPDNYVSVDNELFRVGNYFQTDAECRAFCDKVKALANGND